jgi:class 3 adenylate cyclase/predicted ATPase
MQCPNCDFDNPPGLKFCGMCGTRLVQACPACGFANPLYFRFCGECGVRLPETDLGLDVVAQAFPMAVEPAVDPLRTVDVSPLEHTSLRLAQLAGERRMVTVILADVSHSTSLLEQLGTERWVEIMNQVLQILEAEVYRYGGEVDQFRGDGLVALFGAASAHEDDPERAVLAALAMQEAIRPYAERLVDEAGIELQLRVGVNSGEVIVASIGDSEQHSEDTAMGEAIALASRMETAAEPGTVLVSEKTYHLIQAQFEWRALGEITVKGLSEPVGVYCPLASRPDAERSRRLQAYGLPTLLVGREEQFAALDGCLQSLHGGRGGIVMVMADEGMGKSHLVAQVRKRFVEPDLKPSVGVTWLQARCHSHEQSWPYSMWSDLLRHWLRAGGLEDDAEVRDHLYHQAQVLWGADVADYYPYLAALLSLPLEEEFADRVKYLHAEGLRQRLFSTIKSWVEEMARQGPLVLAFEDVHWVDATSLSLLQYCLPLCESAPIQWWLMFRLDRTSRIWDFRHFVETEYPHRMTALTLAPLTEAQSGQMLDQLVGPQVLPERLRAMIVEKAGGNPYYIEELIQSLSREGVLVRDAWTGEWRATRAVTSLELPDTLRSLLLAHIDDLDVEERRVLQMAAVIGTVFWENVLAELVDDSVLLPEHLTALQRAQLILERGRVPDLGTEYVFKSSLVRDAAYDSVLSAQRIVYHRQIADHLAELFGQEFLSQYYGVVAHHYRHAQEARKELFYAMSAAEHAQGIYANAEAVAHYARALELLDRLGASGLDRAAQDWRLECLRGIGQVSFGMGDIVQAEAYFRQAIALGHEIAVAPRELVLLYYWLGEVLFWQNRYDEQIEAGETGLRLLDDACSVEAALMNQEIAIARFEQGDRETFREYTYRTAQFLRKLPYVQELRPAYNHVSKALRADKRVEEAIEWLLALEQHAQAHHDLRALGEAHYLAGDMLADQGDPWGALARAEKAADLFASIGDAKHESWCLGNASWASLMLARLDAAWAYARRGLDLALAVGNRRDIAWAYWRVGQVTVCRGDWNQALAAFQDAARLFGDLGRRRSAIRAAHAAGRVYLAQGERQKAVQQFRSVVVLAEPEAVRQDTFSLAAGLSALESAYESAEGYRAFCRSFRQEHPQFESSSLVQWYLEPTDAPALDVPTPDAVTCEGFEEGNGWSFVDPSGKSSLVAQGGLEIYAARGSGLWLVNQRAPRMLRAVDGNWAMQTVCGPALGRSVEDGCGVVGGLLLWKDEENYLCLDRGAGGPREIALMGSIANRDVVIGRGCLPQWLGPADRVFLRMRRTEERVDALCSVDGDVWFSVGHVDLPVDDPVQVGVYAIGIRDPVIYPHVCADNAAVRFEAFRMWRVKA